MDEREQQSVDETKRVLDLLLSSMPKIAAERKMDNLLWMMADLGRSLVMADRCSLWILDEDRDELWTKVAHGVDELRIPASEGIVGCSARTCQPLLIEDAYQDSRFDRSCDEKTSYRTKSIMTLPLLSSRGKVMGVYQAINKMSESQTFDRMDLERLNLIAVYSSKTIESALLLAELEATQSEIIHILGEASEYRSQETGNHVHRVSEISYRLAQFYGMSQEECEQIRLTVPMHDLGKIGVPDAVLNKPGRLTDVEFAVMKSHTIIGEEILNASKRKLLRFAGMLAGSHHEHWDGTGYPRGISGENIPLAGRICALADVLDALATARCYKEAWPEGKVKTELLRLRGKQFQPELVDILMDHWDEIFELYRDESSHSAELDYDYTLLR